MYKSFIENEFDDCLLLIISKGDISDIISYFLKEMHKYLDENPMPIECSILDEQITNLIKKCNNIISMNLNLENTESVFKEFMCRIEIIKRRYLRQNKELIKGQNRTELHKMWDENIACLFELNSFINAHQEFLTRLTCLIQFFFSKTPFLKCKESRVEAYEEWVANKDFHNVFTMFRNLSELEIETLRIDAEYHIEQQVNYSINLIFKDCNKKLANTLKFSTEADR